MNDKGFTLVEILVSFVIMSIVAGVMINVLFTIKERSDISYAMTQVTIAKSNISKLLKEDLDNDILTEINNCYDYNPILLLDELVPDCYEFVFSTLGAKRLKMDYPIEAIKYGNITRELPDGAYLQTPLSLTNNYVAAVPSGNNSILKIKIPIRTTFDSKNHDIEIVHQFIYSSVILNYD